MPVFQEANLAEMGFVIEHAEADFAIAEDQEQVDKLLAIRADPADLATSSSRMSVA